MAQPASIIDGTRIAKNEADTTNINYLNQQCWSQRATDPKSAIAIGLESLKMAQKIGFYKGAAQAMNYLGICYLSLGDAPTASHYFFKTLSFADSLNLTIEKGNALNNIASSLVSEREYRKALGYTQKSLKLQIQNHDSNGIAYAWLRMSDVYSNLEQNDSLLIAAQYAYVLFKELDIKENVLNALINIGRAREKMGEDDAALTCYLEIINDSSATEEIVQNLYGELIRFYNRLKLPNQSVYYAEKWLKGSKNNDIILKNIAKAYALKGDYKEALRYSLMSIAIRDSLLKEESFRQINNLEILHETREVAEENTDLKLKLNNKNLLISAFVLILFLISLLVLLVYIKRNQLIQLNKLLNQKNDEISLQHDNLLELNQTKDKFFSIIAHDLRGPIGNTSALLAELTMNESEYTKQELLENLILISDSSNATFKLLENLLTWARDQKGEIVFNPLKNDLFKLVQSNIELFTSLAQNKKTTIVNSLDAGLIFDFDHEMINTVIRNLINNAIKFTNENGQINIIAHLIGDEIEITVHDNGIGMESEYAKKLFIRNLDRKIKQGTKGESGTGLGLILCKEFIERHHGKIWVESEPGKGSAFKFTLPVSQPTQNQS
jgi:signal transduction histidine kinase